MSSPFDDNKAGDGGKGDKAAENHPANVTKATDGFKSPVTDKAGTDETQTTRTPETSPRGVTFSGDTRRHARSWSAEIAGSPLGVSNASDETIHPGTLVRHVVSPIPEESSVDVSPRGQEHVSPGDHEPATPSRTSKLAKYSPAKLAKAAVKLVKRSSKKDAAPGLQQIQEEPLITWEYMSGTRKEHFDEGPPSSPTGPPPPPPSAAGPAA